jgi:ATP synthase protein I
MLNVTPFKVVGAQVLATGVVALLAAWWGGAVAGYSALVGGAVVFIPSAWFALWLSQSRRGLARGPAAFFLGQALKLALSCVLLGVAVVTVRPLVWPALLLGLVLALKSYWVWWRFK